MKHMMKGHLNIAWKPSEFALERKGTRPIGATRRDRLMRNFVLQMGFEEPALAVLPRQYDALTFQPRIVLVLVAAGILLQSQAVFAALGALLVGSALFPRRNPFSALYNLTMGGRPGAFRLGPGPAPRRGAERMAGMFAFAIALLIVAGFNLAAHVLQAVFLAASLAAAIGGFCLGTFAYHLRHGNVKFALATLPWAKSEMSYEVKGEHHE